jgi:hypothetical protein
LDCGESDLAVLEFDHVGEKKAGIADIVNKGISESRVRAEIECCEVVCANCHRRRTASRQGSWRAALISPDAEYLDGSRWRQRRNVLYVRDILSRSACLDCQETDICVLEFDHVAEKHKSVSLLMWGEYSLATLAEEIAKCEIRCANCHRRRTAASWELGRRAA